LLSRETILTSAFCLAKSDIGMKTLLLSLSAKCVPMLTEDCQYLEIVVEYETYLGQYGEENNNVRFVMTDVAFMRVGPTISPT
jgi:hypothetical protein